jgi:hypothetical protein
MMDLKSYQTVTPAQMNAVAVPMIALVLLGAFLWKTFFRRTAERSSYPRLRILFFGFLTCVLLSPVIGKYPRATFWSYYYHLHLASVICLALLSFSFFYFDKSLAWFGLIIAAFGTLVLLGPALAH